MAAPPNPLPVALPPQPNDPNIPLPNAPVYPPTKEDVLEAVAYRGEVHVSIATGDPCAQCTPEDSVRSILYEHSVIAQAAAHAGLEVPPPAWLQQLQAQIQNLEAQIQQLRTTIQDQ